MSSHGYILAGAASTLHTRRMGAGESVFARSIQLHASKLLNVAKTLTLRPQTHNESASNLPSLYLSQYIVSHRMSDPERPSVAMEFKFGQMIKYIFCLVCLVLTIIWCVSRNAEYGSSGLHVDIQSSKDVKNVIKSEVSSTGTTAPLLGTRGASNITSGNSSTGIMASFRGPSNVTSENLSSGTTASFPGTRDPSPKANVCQSGEDQRLITLDEPATLANTTGIIDPSMLARRVSLPWRRDDWCTLSPCLTVTNTTQRVAEVPNFEGWVHEKQKKWSTAFAPLLFEHTGEMYWSAPTEAPKQFLHLRNATHGFQYTKYIKPLETENGCEHWVNVTGNTLLWMNFHYGNYGHYLHDHAPAIVALLDILGSSVSWVALPYSELSKKWLCWFDPALLERVIFYPAGKVICSNSTTLIPMNEHGDTAQDWRHPATMSLLNQKAHELHYQTEGSQQEEPLKLVFASRNSKTAKHGRTFINEPQVLDSIRQMMKLYNRTEELVIYDGDGVTYEDQFNLFSKAAMIMGPHGSAMSNVLWSRSHRGCQKPVDVIEFVGGLYSGPQIQKAYRGYYDLEGTVPWVNYHMLTFQDNSTLEETSVSIGDVESALSWIWGGLDTGSNTCLTALRRLY